MKHRLLEQIERLERYHRYAKACLEILDHPAWECIRDAMEAENKVATHKLVHDKLTPQEFGQIQGSIWMVEKLLSIPKANAAKLTDIDRQLSALRDKLQQRDHLGLDDDWVKAQQSELAKLAEFLGAKV